jgi:hypothetical protein
MVPPNDTARRLVIGRALLLFSVDRAIGVRAWDFDDWARPAFSYRRGRRGTAGKGMKTATNGETTTSTNKDAENQEHRTQGANNTSLRQ